MQNIVKFLQFFNWPWESLNKKSGQVEKNYVHQEIILNAYPRTSTTIFLPHLNFEIFFMVFPLVM